MEETVSIGSRIKSLRKRNGRTQEDLARALGISCQAVSRWEIGGGSPDISMIPAIAHYFHISIDQLFGYDNNTQSKIDSTIEQVHDMRKDQAPQKEILALLRRTCGEFPNNDRLRFELAKTLSDLGWSQRGARSYSTDSDIYPHNDDVWNKDNRYWQESISIFTSLYDKSSDLQLRRLAGQNLIFLHHSMGEYDRAVSLAEGFEKMEMSRETMLYHASDGKERCAYSQAELITCLDRLRNSFLHVLFSRNHWAEGEGKTGLKHRIDALKKLAELYEFIYADGNMGQAHGDICELYLILAAQYARLAEEATESKEEKESFLDSAFAHLYTALYHSCTYDRLRQQDSHPLTAFLVDHLTEDPKTWKQIKDHTHLPESQYLADLPKLKKDPRFVRWADHCKADPSPVL